MIGAYDSKLLDIDYDRSKYDFICFTNNKKIKSKTWDLIIVDPIIPNDFARSSYWYKWSFHKFLDYDLYDYAVWVDSSMWYFNIQKFEEYLNKFIQMEDCKLFVEKHPSRHTLTSERDANIHLNKDDHQKMINTVNKYLKDGFNDVTDCVMYETGFSFRRFKDPDLIKMCDLLWSEISNVNLSKRDQLILDWAIWKTKIRNKVKTFTFEQKSEILKFADHPHKSTYTEKVLLCGPWQSEIGWELFTFQGYLRFLSQTEAFDKIVIGTEPENKFLYDDFVDQIIMSPSVGVKNKWQLNGKDPYFKIQNTQDKEIRLVRPNEDLVYNLLANLEKQELIPYNFPEEFRKKYSNINFDEVNEALRTKNIPNYLRKQLNLPLKNNFKIVVVGGNCEKYVEKCINSIKNQTNQNWECCISITKSNDKTYEIAKKFENDKIKVIETPKDFYVIQNVLKALEYLKPENDNILVFVDLDDFIEPNAIELVDIEYMKNPELKLTHGSWKTYPENVNIPSNCVAYNHQDFQRGIRKSVFKGTHLRTMKFEVFKNIDHTEFKHTKTGEIYSAASDVAIMASAIESCGIDRIKFIPQQIYNYNRENVNNEDKIKRDLSIENTIDVARKPIVQVKNFDKYRKISLYDKTFATGIGNGSLNTYDYLIEWDRTNLQRDCIFFTDFTFNEVDRFSNKEKYCFLIESKVIFPQIYEEIKHFNNKFKYVFTFDEKLLKLGENYKQIIIGGSWISPIYQKIYDKTKLISTVASSQNRVVGHILRHQVKDKFGERIEGFGKLYNRFINSKLEALKDYKFAVVIENTREPNYFSEKLIDALSVGSVPIYWGCPNIKNFGFSVDGIIEFDTLEDLDKIVKKIEDGKIKYEDFSDSIKFNFEKCKEYQITENWMFNKYFKDLKV